MPPYMEPITTIISATIGTRAMEPTRRFTHPCRVMKLSPCSLGASPRHTRARRRIIVMNERVSTIPGTNPAM